MNDVFPSPTLRVPSRTKVFLHYLDYFRGRIVAKVEGLDEAEQRRSRLPSGWTPVELLKHLTFVELRWLEWGFEGHSVAEPWGDQRDGRWYVAPTEAVEDLVAALEARGARSRTIIEANDLAAVGRPGARWAGAEPATLERVLFHLLQGVRPSPRPPRRRRRAGRRVGRRVGDARPASPSPRGDTPGRASVPIRADRLGVSSPVVWVRREGV